MLKMRTHIDIRRSQDITNRKDVPRIERHNIGGNHIYMTESVGLFFASEDGMHAVCAARMQAGRGFHLHTLDTRRKPRGARVKEDEVIGRVVTPWLEDVERTLHR